MKVIIAGSRGVSLLDFSKAMESCPWTGYISLVVSGTAKGPDLYGEEWARDRALDIERHPAKWDIHGKRAGPIRNVEMARVAHGLIAVWDGHSRGTSHMIKTARAHGLRVHVYNTNKGEAVGYPAKSKLAQLWRESMSRAEELAVSFGPLLNREAQYTAGIRTRLTEHLERKSR